MNSLKQSVSQLIETKNYPDVIEEALRLIVDGKMNSLALDELLASRNIRRITDMKEYTLDVILDYAEIALADNVLTNEELTNMRMLKLFFKIQERDFDKNGKMKRVSAILTKQLERLYADNVIDKEEMFEDIADLISKLVPNKPIDYFSPMTEEFMEKNIHRLNWSMVCRWQKLSEAFIERHLDKFDMTSLCQEQKLSQSFMERHAD